MHGANSQESPALAAADRKVITPLIYSREYIPFLLEYCKQEKIDLLLPLFDIDIRYWQIPERPLRRFTPQ